MCKRNAPSEKQRRLQHEQQQHRKNCDRVVLVYERHDQDARYRLLGEVCETVSTKYGTGGGNMPIVVVSDDREDEE